MCGICGIICWDNKKEISLPLLKKMANTLSHRGPDDDGFYIENIDGFKVGIGHRRLSIIDLVTGKQPIFNEDKSILTILNGEIYNFPSLREELIKNGHIFQTKSDTEVIVHLYEEMGIDFLKKLSGMFSIAIFDKKNKRLLLARDRVGKKPLYYCQQDGWFAFGSEIKAIKILPFSPDKIDPFSIDDYLSYGFIPSPKTIYKDVYQIPPGHIGIWENQNFILKRYWEIDYSNLYIEDEEEAIKGLEHKLKEAVQKRLISDVPLGAFLSGGIDSSLIVALMSKLSKEKVKTFSIGFEEKRFDETIYARKVANLLNLDHKEFIVTYNIKDLLPTLIEHFDEPFADSSAIPTYYLSKMTKDEVTVALSGDAGDEIFGGYRRYLGRRLSNIFNKIMPLKGFIEKIILSLPESDTYTGKSFIKKLKRGTESAKMYDDYPFLSWLLLFNPEEKKRIFAPDFLNLINGYDSLDLMRSLYNNFPKNKDTISYMMWADLHTYLPDDILVKVDRMSMAHGLEVRCPFLDHEIIEFMAHIPLKMKIKGLTTKYLLKKVAIKYLPPDIVKRAKHGFVVPLAKWFKRELQDIIKELLIDSPPPFLSKKYIKELIILHQKGKKDLSFQIWALLILSLWFYKKGGTL